MGLSFLGTEGIAYCICQPLRRQVYMGEAGHVINESGNELIPGEFRLILSLSALNKVQSFVLSSCGQEHNIRVVVVGMEVTLRGLRLS